MYFHIISRNILNTITVDEFHICFFKSLLRTEFESYHCCVTVYAQLTQVIYIIPDIIIETGTVSYIKVHKEKLEARAKKYPSVSYEIADQIYKEIGSEVRVTVPGHTQRGGEPCPYDRVLSTRIGAGAAQAIIDGAYGIMIGVVNGKIKRVPLEECAGKLKMVSPKDQLVQAAKQIGISFGD